jgi:hypothetical protein
MAAATTSSGGWRRALEAQLENMSRRDRMLLVGLLGFLGLVIAGGFGIFLKGMLEDKASRVAAASTDQEMLELLSAEYDGAAGKIAAAEEKLKANKDTPPSAYIDQVSARVGVQTQLSAVNEGESQKIGNLKQTQYRVELKAITLPNVVDFIHNLETGDYPMVVQLARIKAINQAAGKVYDLSLDVRAYRLEEG